MTTQFLFMLY